MRRNKSYIGKSSGIGCGIFFIMIVAFPILSWIFNTIDYILSNIGFILYLIGLVLIIGFVSYFISKAEDEEEEM